MFHTAIKQRKERFHTHEARDTRFHWQMMLTERYRCDTNKLKCYIYASIWAWLCCTKDRVIADRVQKIFHNYIVFFLIMRVDRILNCQCMKTLKNIRYLLAHHWNVSCRLFSYIFGQHIHSFLVAAMTNPTILPQHVANIRHTRVGSPLFKMVDPVAKWIKLLILALFLYMLSLTK